MALVALLKLLVKASLESMKVALELFQYLETWRGKQTQTKEPFNRPKWDTFSPGKQEYLRREYESDIRPGAGIPGIGPLIGAAWDTDIGQSIGGSIGDWGSKLNIEQQEIMDANALTPQEYHQPSFFPGVPRGDMASGAESVLPAALGLGLGYLTKSPAVGLSTMIAPTMGSKYAEERAEGTPVNVAQDRMVRSGLEEAGSEIFTLFPMLRFGKPIFGRILQTLGTEALGESLTSAAEMMDDYVAKGIKPTKEQVVQRLWSSAAIGGLLGGAMGAPTIAAQELLAPTPPELNEMTRSLATKEAEIIADSLPFDGVANIVTGQVKKDDGTWAGSAEFIPDVSGQGERLIINIDNLILRSDGTRSGIKAQLLQDVTHELSGHGLAQKMFTGNEHFFDQSFKANEDLIKLWFEKSAYNEGPEPLDYKEDRKIVYEEWMSSLAEMDAKVLRRIELSIVNYLHKLIGKDATAKLLKSWDARNITVRNIARAHMKQIRDRKAAGEEARVQTITAEQSQALDRPIEGDSIRESRGNIQDPSRRKFMKQAAGAVAGAAVDPSILLEPATPVAPPAFGGGIMRPGIAPEYESAMRAAEMASPSGLVGDVASEAFDDFDFDVAAQEDADLQARLDEYDSQQAEKEKVPQAWRELETPELQALMEDNRAKGNAIWVAQNKELESRAAEVIPQLTSDERVDLEEVAESDAELYVETIDEIMNIYDDDATAAEAAEDGTLNDRVISYAAETPFTREELWDGVNQRIEEAAEDTATPARRFSRARKPKSETVQRDINEEKGKVNRRITALDVEEAEKEERKNLLKRLQNIMGAPARKRGIDAGDQDVFKEQAAKIVAGDLEAVEAFIKPFEEKKTGSTETVYKADRRRALRAERIGKTDAEILKYRPKGAKHPMEGKMTYPFALEEIDRQEKAGEITAEEAEIRRPSG